MQIRITGKFTDVLIHQLTPALMTSPLVISLINTLNSENLIMFILSRK